MTNKPKDAASKIKTIEELGRIADGLNAQGESVVLAHGAFDLLHFGHVRHLQAAKGEGTVLMVTLTADAYVNKGPNRPVFPDHVRAEMVASLECVDWVGVNTAPSAENVLRAIKPKIYAKGREYASAEDDVTGKIVSESQAVEDGGGKVVFTDGITFSSSNLLNQHFNIYEPKLQQHLDLLRSENALDRLLAIIEKASELKVAMIGDAIIDEYQYVEAMGKASKENIISTRHQKGEVFAGGVVAAANHAASFCKEVELVTCLGGRDSHEDLIREILKDNVKLTVIRNQDAPTTRKCRFIDHGYAVRKLFEVSYLDDRPLKPSLQREVDAAAAAAAEGADMLVVNDFGHGLIGQTTIGTLLGTGKFMAVNAQTNSANFGFNLISRYPRADYVCIDGPEARLAVGDKFSHLHTIVGSSLPNVIDCGRIVVTSGKHGCYAYEKGEGANHVPGLTSSIVDTIGAGDAFLAVSAPMIAAGASVQDAAFIGNAAGALKVGIIGHRSSVDKPSLVKTITALLK